MPELPDVEGFRAALAERLPGRKVDRIDVRDTGVLRNTTSRALGQRLCGHRFRTPRRHGKWLILPTDGPTLLVHSGMTGHPYFASSDVESNGSERLVLTLDRGELRYADLRKLRGIWLADDEDAVWDVIGPQGPDALNVDLSTFAAALCRKRGQLKAVLTDQTVIAGLGNLLADEICWQARINPARHVTDLDETATRLLHSTMRRVLRTSVRHGRVPGLRRWLTRVRDDPGARCPRCATRLERGRIRGRTTLWCPQCQPPPP